MRVLTLTSLTMTFLSAFIFSTLPNLYWPLSAFPSTSQTISLRAILLFFVCQSPFINKLGPALESSVCSLQIGTLLDLLLGWLVHSLFLSSLTAFWQLARPRYDINSFIPATESLHFHKILIAQPAGAVLKV